jgi:integrase
LRASDNMAALALEFLIVTATRTAETLGMQWDEIDRDNAVWVVPGERMKTGEEFSVPLSDRAAEIIPEARSRARKEPTADRFVFFGVIPKRPLSNMALSMLMRRMNATETVHGFRTSFRTWASEIGHVEFEICGKLSQPPRRECCVESLQQIEPLGEAAPGNGRLGELRRGRGRRQGPRPQR